MYDKSFVNAAAERSRSMLGQKYTGGDAAGYREERPETLIRGIQVEFLANGFLVSPQSDYLGTIHRVAHVARDKDELLKLVGEMIDAHAKG